jgi:hypothetical protein
MTKETREEVVFKLWDEVLRKHSDGMRLEARCYCEEVYLFSRVMRRLLNKAHKMVWEVLGVTYVMMEIDFARGEGVILQESDMVNVLPSR